MQGDMEGIENEEPTESDAEEAGETRWTSRSTPKFNKALKTMFSHMIDGAKRTAAREVAAEQDAELRHTQSTSYDINSYGGGPVTIPDLCVVGKKKRR